MSLRRTGSAGLALVVAATIAVAAAVAAKADLIGHAAPVRDIVISPDGTRALTTGFDDLAILWDLESRTALLEFVGHEAAVNAGGFAGDTVATVGDDGALILWDGETAKSTRVIRAHDKKVVSIAVSPDGRLVATGAWDRTVKLWETGTGREVRRFDQHKNSVNAVLFEPGGTHLVSAGYDGTVWRLPVGETDGEARLLFNAGFPVNDIAVDAAGRVLVVGSADGFVRGISLPDGETLFEQKGHEGAVLAVAISSDGRLVASGSTDGYLVLWDGGGESTQRLPVEYYRAVWSIAFTPDGEQVFAAGVDNVARGWFTATGKPVAGETTPFQPIRRASAALADSPDIVERGSYQYRKCAVCHSLREDGKRRAGPSLDGIFGRKVGTYPGYTYSPALEHSDVIWTPETLSRLFEVGPDVMLPGTKMPLQKLPRQEDRDALIAFLKARTRGPE